MADKKQENIVDIKRANRLLDHHQLQFSVQQAAEHVALK